MRLQCDNDVDQLSPGDSLTEGEVTVELAARAELPTQFGDFMIFVFRSTWMATKL